MVEFVLLAVVIGGFITFAQLFSKMRYMEQRLSQLERDSLHRPVERVVQSAPDAANRPDTSPIRLPDPPPSMKAPLTKAPEPESEQAPAPIAARRVATIVPPPVTPLDSPSEPARVVAYNTADDAPSLTEQPAVDAGRTKGPKLSGLSINFEELFGRRLPIWAGGITLAIAGVFIVQYAIDIGLFGRIFTPVVQAIMGTIFGLGLIAGGEWAHQRQDKVDDPRVPQALSGAGISTLYAAVLVAANVYGLLPAAAAFVLLALITAGALALSMRHGLASAVLGLAGGLAAPALTVGLSANVPMLSVYLAVTIAGMVWVSRVQRWAWLGLAAMTGGALWSALLILIGDLTAGFSVVAVGGFALLLALVLPTMTREDGGAKGLLSSGNLRAVAAVVGAAQLALLVATGGFAMLNWGLYALLAIAGQAMTLPPLAARFADHAKALAVVPRVSAALAVLLLIIWPRPDTSDLVLVALAMAVIHIPAMLYRLWWPKDAGEWAAWEVSAAALSIAAIYARHCGTYWDGTSDIGTAVALTAGAALALTGAALGWQRAERHGDRRFVILITVAGGLLMAAALAGLPLWQAPIAFAAISAAWFGLGRIAKEARVDGMAIAPLGVTIMSLGFAVAPQFEAELWSLIGQAPDVVLVSSVLRWGAVAALAALFAWQLRVEKAQKSALTAVAALLGYGVAAQCVPAIILPILVAAAVLALVLVARRRLAAPPQSIPLLPAMMALSGVALAWMILPVGLWGGLALPSLFGEPMVVGGPYLSFTELVRRMVGPATILGAGLWLVQGALGQRTRRAGWAIIGIVTAVAVHSLYRIAFAAAFGSDFTATGLLQRFGWEAILAGGAFALWRFGKGEARETAAPILLAAALAHLALYSLLVHNPLWAEQSVGSWPLINFILPLFAALPVGLFAISHMRADAAARIAPVLQPVIIVMLALAAWASVRQIFHGAVLVGGGLAAGEDIARSLLGLALAVGYLLWGIRTQSRIWRIASLGLMLLSVGKVFLLDAAGLDGLARIGSFIALGFTLIGIGWLYARQLRREESIVPS